MKNQTHNIAAIKPSKLSRFLVSATAVIVPALLLIKGIFGSFIFTFSIPLLWQFGFMGKPITSLGIRADKIKASIVIGIITGCLLGLVGGIILKSLGIAGYIFNNLHKLQFSFGPLNVVFSLKKELGYQLLSMSNSFVGLCIYLVFSIFIIGFGEEFFWRGLIQQKLFRYISVNLSILTTAILFSLIHFYVFTILPISTGILFLLLIAIAGIAWGYLLKYFDNEGQTPVSLFNSFE